jgi:5'-methylthioadenosine phosphorylase
VVEFRALDASRRGNVTRRCTLVRLTSANPCRKLPTVDHVEPRADIAVIGGTGLYSLLPEGERVEMGTPYGPPSSSLVLHEIAGRRVAFLARHGDQHQHPAHQVPYRANMWAIAELGVTRVLGVCAVGSLRENIVPGSIAVPDQLIDRTYGRAGTFYDDAAIHVSFADPYCPVLREASRDEASRATLRHHDGGVLVVVNGPRFGTRAEAAVHRQMGADLVNMTAMPEAVLARERWLCYCSIAVVTDWDAALDWALPVTQAMVMDRVAESMKTVRDFVLNVVEGLDWPNRCRCASS